MFGFILSILHGLVPVAKAADSTGSTVTTTTIDPDVINSVERTSKLLDQYGVEIVLLSVFIVIFIIILTVIILNNRKLINELIEENKAKELNTEEIIKTTVNACVTSFKEAESQLIQDSMEQSFKKEKEFHKKAIQYNINAYAIFEEATKAVMRELHCQRIGIYLLHNGNETPYGYPFAKASCVYEYTFKGPVRTVRGSNHMNLPLYAFSRLIEHLMNYDDCLVDSIDEYGFQDAESKQQFIDFVSGSNITSLYALAIRDNSGIIAAFTTIEYDSSDKLHIYPYNEFKQIANLMNSTIKPIIIDQGFISGYEHPTYASIENKK